MEPVFDAVTYAIAYKFARAVGLSDAEAVRHAALKARAAQGFARIAQAIRDLDDEEV